MSTQSQHKAEHGHHATHPFTLHEQTLIEMAHRQGQFQLHHHHHHHYPHLDYRRPFELTTEIGLFALKKINAMNPEILTQHDKRLLNASAPGVITHLVHASFTVGVTGYTAYIWRKLGVLGFSKPAVVVPLAGMIGSWIGVNWVANQLRQMQFSPARKRMISKYTDLWGSKFLLDVLEPTFRLPEQISQQ